MHLLSIIFFLAVATLAAELIWSLIACHGDRIADIIEAGVALERTERAERHRPALA